MNQLTEMQIKYPIPKFVLWYQNEFPIREYILIGCGFVALGFFLTLFEASRTLRAIPTFIVCLMLLFAASLHIPAWYMKRRVERKRAEFLGISLQDYYNLPESWKL